MSLISYHNINIFCKTKSSVYVVISDKVNKKRKIKLSTFYIPGASLEGLNVEEQTVKSKQTYLFSMYSSIHVSI